MNSTNALGYYDPFLAARGDKIMQEVDRYVARHKGPIPAYFIVRPAVWDCLVGKLVQQAEALEHGLRDTPPDTHTYFAVVIYGCPMVCTHRPGADDWAFSHTLPR